MSVASRSGWWLAVFLLACSAPPVQTGVNPVDGCATDGDCPKGYHCAGGACQLFPRPCLVDPQCDPGQSCQKGNCLPANRGFCEPCTTTADCAPGGLCVSFPDGGGDYCSAPCGTACGAARGQCAVATDAQGNDAGETCLPESGGCGTPAGLDGGGDGG